MTIICMVIVLIACVAGYILGAMTTYKSITARDMFTIRDNSELPEPISPLEQVARNRRVEVDI
jgi:hypothetical protein